MPGGIPLFSRRERPLFGLYSAGYGAVTYRLLSGPAYRYNAYGLRVARVP